MNDEKVKLDTRGCIVSEVSVAALAWSDRVKSRGTSSQDSGNREDIRIGYLPKYVQKVTATPDCSVTSREMRVCLSASSNCEYKEDMGNAKRLNRDEMKGSMLVECRITGDKGKHQNGYVRG